jgi:hypothetical protein
MSEKAHQTSPGGAFSRLKLEPECFAAHECLDDIRKLLNQSAPPAGTREEEWLVQHMSALQNLQEAKKCLESALRAQSDD